MTNCRKRPIEELDWSETDVSDTLVDITTLGTNLLLFSWLTPGYVSGHLSICRSTS